MRLYQKEINEVLKDLSSSLQGLSSQEAMKRLETYGRNELTEKKKRTLFMMFLDQFKDFMILVLMGAAVISGMIGDFTDTIAIVIIVVLNAVIGFVQEYRAEKAMAALKQMASPTALVLRDGRSTNVPAFGLVPGDIVILDTGKVVPADMRLIEAVQLKVEEAALTGESVPVEKHTKTLCEDALPLGDRKNMAFKGTVVSYGRGSGVAPEQKLKIIKALQDKGQFVAMTGDGVNDAPALKRADIGVSMGITGTDVAKESSHMIILDDNFATIVKAVKEGRRIFDNMRKFIKYTMTSNSGEIWAIFLAPFFGLPIPLLPIHILWINLVTDGLPDLALAAEKEEKGLMKRPPRHPQESIFAHGLGAHILWVGLLMGAVSIFTQAWSIMTGHAHWQTMVFTVLCLRRCEKIDGVF